jgi:hypothetical protein
LPCDAVNSGVERLLRLGLVSFQKDYTCCVSCVDPTLCAKLLDEKWRSAWSAAFRFGGSPQPSLIYRSLRQLEPSIMSPALLLTHTACQMTAKAYVADLFDRLFGIGGSATSSFGRAFSATNPGRMASTDGAARQGAKVRLLAPSSFSHDDSASTF